jgi:hypothetical protein
MRAERNDWTRNCFEAALAHLYYAHRLIDVDPAMAVFRAITAEEEAATGLLRALRIRKYPKAGHLRFRDHVHKAAVYPFLLAIVKHASYLKLDGIKEFRLAFPKDEDRPKLALAIVLTGDTEVQVVRPTPPLNFRLREGHKQSFPDYRRYFLQVVSSSGYDDIRKYLESKANERNLILYASQQGLPQLENVPNGYLLGQKTHVLTIFKAALLVWPYDEVQPFAEEAIEAFLGVTEKLKTEPSPE